MAIMNESRPTKNFRDAVHGYIEVDKVFVKYLIDTFEMQRLKDVTQTGISPLYNGATHNRFAHSLGVYHIGNKIYESFSLSLISLISTHEDLRNMLAKEIGVIPPAEIKDRVEIMLHEYKPVFQMACLLHDIGHPATSHTFEYVYDNKYIRTEYNDYDPITLEDIKTACNDSSSSSNNEALKQKLIEAIMEAEGDDAEKSMKIDASPHEMMSAYQILKSQFLAERICQCYFRICGDKSCMTEHEFENIVQIEERDERRKAARKSKTINKYSAFMARMITGTKYTSTSQPIMASIKNCLIALLNGKIDADSIDYLNRNAQLAGYDTYHLDVERICQSFSAYYDTNEKIIIPCFSKTGLNAIEGFVVARNYEPKWLYTHHKIVYYNEFLMKFLFVKCCDYLFAISTRDFWAKEYDGIRKLVCQLQHAPNDYCDGLETIRNNIKEKIKDVDSNLVTGALNESLENLHVSSTPALEPHLKQIMNAVYYNHIDKIQDTEGCEDWNHKLITLSSENQRVRELYGKMKKAFMVYILAPTCTLLLDNLSGLQFHKTTDSDINALFKMMYYRYRGKDYEALTEEEKSVGTPYSYRLFKEALRQHYDRNYHTSLWKSEYEYSLFLNDVESIVLNKYAETSGSEMETGKEELVDKCCKKFGKKHTLELKQMLADFFLDECICKGRCEEFNDPASFDIDDSEKEEKKIEKTRARNCVYVKFDVSNAQSCEEYQRFRDIFNAFTEEEQEDEFLIVKVCQAKYKYFGNLKIRFEDRNNLIDYKDIGIVSEKNRFFPYVYYKDTNVRYQNSDKSRKRRQELWDSVANLLAETFLNYVEEKNDENPSST